MIRVMLVVLSLVAAVGCGQKGPLIAPGPEVVEPPPVEADADADADADDNEDEDAEAGRRRDP